MRAEKELFSEFLRKNGIRYSQQRQHILETFLKSEKHLTVAELYELVRKKYANVGYATIYRALKIICDSGFAREVDFGTGVARFEHAYGHEHHDHLVCTSCGKFIEAVDPEIEKLQERMARKHGFLARRHTLQIFGICSKCNRKRS